MSAYRDRERDTDFMLWVKLQPCMWRDLSRCAGVVEADHAGRRPVGRKAPDDTCVPTCMLHHRQRTDCSGPFRHIPIEEVRARLDAEIERMRQGFARYRAVTWW